MTGKKTQLNGYWLVYMPSHPRAFNNGCVYEHVLVAEDILGRELNPGECVHHKDRKRSNNSPDNLMVFKSNADHVSFHMGQEIYLEDGVWVAEPADNTCPYCNQNLKASTSKMCMQCYLKEVSAGIPPKEEIENLIYTLPFTRIGELYGVSDNAVRKWCKKYGLPFRKSDINQLIACRRA